jgi:hypothetical protein
MRGFSGVVEVVGADVVEDGEGEEVREIGTGGEESADLGGAGGVVDACKYVNTLELSGGQVEGIELDGGEIWAGYYDPIG